MKSKYPWHDLRFNIIFTPGTVRYMRIFTLSLLKWLKCSFRLVSNGCSGKEIEQLEGFCRRHSRLDFFSLPFSGITRHDIALNYLQKLETSANFCFMDSDIFAAGDFLNQVYPLPEGFCAVFSGRPAWQEKAGYILPGNQHQVKGRFIRTNKGILLGCSYFAIYDNQKLTSFIDDSGLAFQKLNWRDIPSRYRQQLEEMGLKSEYYDTGKVLNILLREKGEKLLYMEPGGLHHLGGFSCLTRYPGTPTPPQTRKITAEQKQLLEKISRLTGNSPLLMNRRLPDDTITKRAVTGYFRELFRALFENLPFPGVPSVDSAEVLEKVEYIKEQVINDYREYKEQL
jgi:hypothetical protein